MCCDNCSRVEARRTCFGVSPTHGLREVGAQPHDSDSEPRILNPKPAGCLFHSWLYDLMPRWYHESFSVLCTLTPLWKAELYFCCFCKASHNLYPPFCIKTFALLIQFLRIYAHFSLSSQKRDLWWSDPRAKVRAHCYQTWSHCPFPIISDQRGERRR